MGPRTFTGFTSRVGGGYVIPLNVRDNQVAEKMKADFIRQKERELNGIAEPKALLMRRKSH